MDDKRYTGCGCVGGAVASVIMWLVILKVGIILVKWMA